MIAWLRRSPTPKRVFFTMSTELPQRIHTRLSGANISIVCARYNEKYTDALLQNCLDELEQCAPYAGVRVIRVPGAFEVPVTVKRLIQFTRESDKPNVVIAFGVILRGSTAHADLVGTAVTNQLMNIACDTMVPVIHEVLLLNDEKQAFARCVASALNRGREAARAAIEMLDLQALERRAVRIAATRKGENPQKNNHEH